MRLTPLLAVAASVVAVLPIWSGVPASARAACANPTGTVRGTADTADANLQCPAVPPTTRPGAPDRKTRTAGKVTKPACVWVPKPDYQSAPGDPVEGEGGHWYQKFCSFGDYETLAEFQQALDGFDVMDTHQTNMLRRAGLEVRFFTTPPEAPRRTPEQVMESIADSLEIPKTFLAVNPAPAKQVVSLPTWVWLTDENGKYDAERYTARSDEIGQEGYQLKWEIVPQVTLSPGVGDPQTCEGAGVPWSAAGANESAACTVTYTSAGRYTLTADVTWTVRWWLAGDRQNDIPGPTNTATQQLTVAEIQTVTR